MFHKNLNKEFVFSIISMGQSKEGADNMAFKSGYEEFHNIVATEQPNICQIVCYKDNQKTYSDVWNDYKEDDAVHIMSATKSIVSLLVGICIDKGLIKSLDDKI